MSTALSLKDNLDTNVAKILKIKKRGGTFPETDFTTKEPTGGSIYLYIFTDKNGKEFKYYAKQREEDVLCLFQPGEEVQVVRKEQMNDGKKRIAFQVWSAKEGVEAFANAEPQLLKNTALKRQELQHEKQKNEEEDKWHDIAVSKIVHNFMRDCLRLGVNPADARNIAFQWYFSQKETVAAILAKERDNAPSTPPISARKPGTIAVRKEETQPQYMPSESDLAFLNM